MYKKMKKIFSIAVAAAMLCTSIEMPVYAQENHEEEPPVIIIKGEHKSDANTYCMPKGEEVILNVTDNEGLDYVTVNDVIVSSSLTEGAKQFKYSLQAGMNQRIKAVDKAGNTSEEIVNIKNNHSNVQVPVTMDSATCEWYPYTGVIYVCQDCGFAQPLMQRPDTGVSKLGHDYQTEHWNMPGGQTADVEICSRCGDMKPNEDINKAEHHWDEEYTIDKAPDCSNDGYKSKHCLDEGCDAKTDIVKLDALAHRWGTPRMIKPGSCTEGAQMERDCTNPDCGKTEVYYTRPYGHVYENTYDCTKETKCKECGDVKEKTIYPEHEYPEDYSSNSTSHWKKCIHEGCNVTIREEHTKSGIEGDCLVGFKCDKCGYQMTSVKHNFGGEYQSDGTHHWLVCQNPGCTQTSTKIEHSGKDDSNCATPVVCVCGHIIKEGEEHDLSGDYIKTSYGHRKKCQNSGCSYYTDTEAHHSSSIDNDCTKGMLCNACGYVIKNGYQAHDINSRVWKTDGTYHWHVCGRTGCNYETEKTEHTTSGNGAVVNIKPANCTEAGSYDVVKRCNVCGEEVERRTVTPGKPLGHSFGEWTDIDVKEGCDDAGVRERTCNTCGYTETENLHPSAHEWEDNYTIDKEATCTEDGSRSIHCKHCKAIYKSEVIPAAHKYGEWEVTITPSCETTGMERRVCDACREEETKVLSATGHSWNEEAIVDKEPTCTDEGSKSVHCKHCNIKKEDTIESIPALEHSYGEWQDVDTPDCDDSGSKRRICDNCGHIDTRNLNPLGHEWESSFTIDKQANCTQSGSMSIHCKNCDMVEETIDIPARGHSFDEWEHIDSAKCDTEGSEYHVCKVCGFSENQNLVEEGHEWMPGYTVDVPATCVNNGSESIHCKNCDATKESKVIHAMEHEFGDWENLESSTCDVSGSQRRVCDRCNYVETKNVVGKKHEWEENYTVDKPASCIEDGSRSIHCANCDTVKLSEVIAATGHDFDEWEYMGSATCDADGSKQRVCKTCKYTDTRNISATGHSWAEEFSIDLPATCTEDGSMSIHCTKCNIVKESKVIPELGHDFGEWEKTEGNECDETGSEHRTCNRCKYTETKNVIGKGHTWSEDYVIDKEATCTEDGSRSIRCTVCKTVKSSEVIPATGHSFTNYVSNNNGTETAKCDRCDETDTRLHSFIVTDNTGNEVSIVKDGLDLDGIIKKAGIDRKSHNIDIVLSEESPDGNDSDKLKKAVEDKDGGSYVFVDAYDILMTLYVDGKAQNEITEDFGEISLSLFAGMDYSGKEAVVYQLHGTEIMPPYDNLTVDERGYVTVSVNKLSAFAVAVKADKPETTPEPTATPPVETSPSETPPAATKEPETTETPKATQVPEATQIPEATQTANPPAEDNKPVVTLPESVTVDGMVYVIAADGLEAAFKEPVNKNLVSVNVPKTVTINGKLYKVTSIAKNAFKNNKKLKKVTIPAGIKAIGSNAFKNCISLRKIVIKSKQLVTKNIGRKAFKNAGKKNYMKLKVKVPKNKVKAYKKLLRKKGLSKKAKIKK